MLDIETAGRGTVSVIVRGELDLPNAPRLRAVLTELLNRGDVTAIELDAGAVTFLDSAGLGTIVVAHRICAAAGVLLRLTAISAFAARMLGVVGAEALLTSGS